ncbi:MAG: hypothetical protein ACOH5I_10960 [Oligoflexus sp.]
MSKLRAKTIGSSIKLHRYFAWFGGLAFLMFGLSGLTHPIMTRTGPQPAQFFPPQAQISPEDLQTLPQILDQFDEARIVKLLPSAGGLKLQISGDLDRRYIDLKTGEELIGYDEQHAIWLARYYSGDWDSKVHKIDWQTEFSDAYPWVNRLLPVYRVQFERDDRLTAFVHTETNALGNLTNDYKTLMQSIFRNIHTWAWLEKSNHFRVLALSMLLVCLFTMSLFGLALIFLLKHRRRMPALRFWHRITSYLVAIPVLAFSASGFYHLLHHAYKEVTRGLALADQIQLSDHQLHEDMGWLERFSDIQMNVVSLVQGPEERLFYRLSLSQGKPAEQVTRNARFDGVPLEKAAVYVDATLGDLADLDDQAMAIYYAEKHFGYDPNLLQQSSLVTQFNHNYDFRNKRLPVWQLEYLTPSRDIIFIDPATGALVDRSQRLDRAEGMSFSILHKWNIVVPLIGRYWRDVLIMLSLVLGLVTTVSGYTMLLKLRR